MNGNEDMFKVVQVSADKYVSVTKTLMKTYNETTAWEFYVSRQEVNSEATGKYIYGLFVQNKAGDIVDFPDFVIEKLNLRRAA